MRTLVRSRCIPRRQPGIRPADSVGAQRIHRKCDLQPCPRTACGRSSKGDVVKSAESRPAKPITDELYDDVCHSRHAVFSCPGTP